jgi:pilus assembly protein CpaE
MSSIALIVGAGDDVAARLSQAIGHRAVALSAQAVAAESVSLLRGIDPASLPEAIVFTADVPVARSLAMAAEVHAVRPDVDMVLIAAVEKHIMLDAMRAGIRDVGSSIEDPAILAGLRDRLNARADAGRPAATPMVAVPPPEFPSRTVTVASPKGGVGKTTISANLAVALAKVAPMEVVLVDLDLQFGDVSTVLDLKPTHTLEDAFALSTRDDLLLKTYLTVHSAGFYVLCGAESPAANDKVTGEQIAQLLGQLREQFKYVVVDTAAGLHETTLAALEHSDEAVVVTTMDLACLRSVQKEIELLGTLSLLPATVQVTVNFADKSSGLRIKDVEATLGRPVDVVVPRSKDLPVAANRGVPVLVSAKSGPIVKSIRAMAKRISDRAHSQATRQGHKRLEVA